MTNRTAEDRDLLLAFAALCVALLVLASFAGLAVRIFLWVAGL